MNNELYHTGVKGMKWGVRKDQLGGPVKNAFLGPKNPNKAQLAGPVSGAFAKNSKSTANLAANARGIVKNYTSSEKTAREAGEKKIAFEKEHSRKNIYETSKSLSNDELQKRINRMNLERSYRSLMYGEAKDGRSYAENKLRDFGNNTIDGLSRKASGRLVESVGKKK